MNKVKPVEIGASEKRADISEIRDKKRKIMYLKPTKF